MSCQINLPKSLSRLGDILLPASLQGVRSKSLEPDDDLNDDQPSGMDVKSSATSPPAGPCKSGAFIGRAL